MSSQPTIDPGPPPPPGDDAAPLPVTRFTTDSFAPADRHEAWANRDWPSIGPVFDTRPEGDFHNRSLRTTLGPVAVHYSDMGAQRYVRTARRARADGIDGLMVEILLTGRTAGDAAGRSIENLSGGMAFDDLGQPHSHVSSDTRTLLLSIPRGLATAHGLDVAALHGRRVAPQASAALRTHLLAVHRQLPNLTVADGQRLGATAIDLIGVALDLGGLRAPAAPRAARATAARMAAERLIEAHLQSPALDVAWLCRSLTMSRSQVYRLFDADGGVQAFVRDRRLDAIHAQIARAPDARLSDVAAHWGFADPAHLSRSFRLRFGMTPSEHRAACRDAPDARRSR